MAASSNETPCFLRFERAFAGSHSKSYCTSYLSVTPDASPWNLTDRSPMRPADCTLPRGKATSKQSAGGTVNVGTGELTAASIYGLPTPALRVQVRPTNLERREVRLTLGRREHRRLGLQVPPVSWGRGVRGRIFAG